nr:SOC1 [Bistorta vivipara]
MVRGKTQMKRIENSTSRQVTFSKRRNGLLKKAFELSVLCEAEVALIVFSARGKLYEFSSNGMQNTIEHYRRHVKDVKTDDRSVEEMQLLKNETEELMKKIEIAEASKRKLFGEGLTSCTIEELQQLEGRLEQSVTKIRARKEYVYNEQIRQLKEKERILAAEHARLSEKCQLMQVQPIEIARNGSEDTPSEDTEDTSQLSDDDVETELFIGLPESRSKKNLQLISTVSNFHKHNPFHR